MKISQRLLIAFLIPVLAHSQTRNEFWAKVNINHAIDKKWSAGLEFHHRRQANYKTGDNNIFHYQLGNYGRLWVYYQLPKKWTLMLSPLGYFNNEDILNEKGELKQTNELRISPGIIKAFEIGKINNRNRFLYDIRFAEFDNKGHFTQSRFRFQDAFIVPLCSFNKKSGLGYFISNEVIIQKNKRNISFDQERLYNALQWKFNSSDLDLGYQWVLQQGSGSTFHRHQLFVRINLFI